MLYERRSTMKELQSKPGDGVALMHRLATVAFETFEQIVGQQFDQQIQFVGFTIAGRNPMDGEAVLGFFDVVFHAAALVVEAPQIKRFPLQIGHDRFVLPMSRPIENSSK